MRGATIRWLALPDDGGRGRGPARGRNDRPDGRPGAGLRLRLWSASSGRQCAASPRQVGRQTARGQQRVAAGVAGGVASGTWWLPTCRHDGIVSRCAVLQRLLGWLSLSTGDRRCRGDVRLGCRGSLVERSSRGSFHRWLCGNRSAWCRLQSPRDAPAIGTSRGRVHPLLPRSGR
jgi:hypothetical protein